MPNLTIHSAIPTHDRIRGHRRAVACRAVWTLLVAALVFLTVSPQAAESSATNVWAESFDIVWRTVKEKHFDTNFAGANWDKVREKYAPQLSSLKNEQELYSLLQEMLGELGQSHFGIVPPEALPKSNSSEADDGWVGIKARFLEYHAVITSVAPESPAAKAALRPGYTILKVGAKTVEEIISPLEKSRLAPGLRAFMKDRLLRHSLDGDAGTTVELTYRDGSGRTHSIKLKREPINGEMSLPLGNFPPQLIEFEARQLAGGIGYIRFNIFMVSQMEKIRAALSQFHNAPGIIFDLRGNPGGLGGMAMGITGLLNTNQTSLGTMQMRSGYLNFVGFPQPNAYTGPVVVLVDGDSASTSEILAAGLKELGRAVVVGERTAGAALPSMFQKLPTGALFQFAFGDFKTPSGKLVEGSGVEPNVPVKLSPKGLLRGHDTQLDAAVKEVQKLSRMRRR